MPQTIHYLVTEADYIAAQRLFRKRASKWARLAMAALVLIGVAMIVVGALLPKLKWLVFVGIAYATIPWWINRLISEPLARRHYRKYPAMHQAQTLTLLEDESGVVATSAIGESRLAWPMLVRWVEDDNHLLLFVQPRLFFVVPKKADPDGQLMQRLRPLLAQHVRD